MDGPGPGTGWSLDRGRGEGRAEAVGPSEDRVEGWGEAVGGAYAHTLQIVKRCFDTLTGACCYRCHKRLDTNVLKIRRTLSDCCFETS